jgi:hypothetical protein
LAVTWLSRKLWDHCDAEWWLPTTEREEPKEKNQRRTREEPEKNQRRTREEPEKNQRRTTFA